MKNISLMDELISRYPELGINREQIVQAADILIQCFAQGRKVLICGNGGSSSDSDHIVGELMKGFESKRPLDVSFKNRLSESGGERGAYLAEKLQGGFPAISLSAHTSLNTATANDTDASLIYAQQVAGYGTTGDILLAISTSGNSLNIIDALITAKAKGITTIGLTGESGGKMKSFCDILINVPETLTANVQELHLPVYHTICRIVENHFYGK